MARGYLSTHNASMTYEIIYGEQRTRIENLDAVCLAVKYIWPDAVLEFRDGRYLVKVRGESVCNSRHMIAEVVPCS